MKLIVEIPEDVKKAFDEATKDDLYGCYYDRNSVVGKAIKDGTPLPKGHGRLIDEDAIKKYIEDGAICHKCVGNGWGCQNDCTFPDYVDYKMEKMLKEQETVVEADKEGAEE